MTYLRRLILLCFLIYTTNVFAVTIYTAKTEITTLGWGNTMSWVGGVVPPNTLPAGDIINIDYLTNIPNALIINGSLNWNTPSDDISFSFPISGTGALNFTAKSIGIIESINLTGSGSLSMTASKNIFANTGSIVSVENGNLTLLANQQVVASSGTFYGVNVNGAIIRSLGTGIVTVKGKGGNTGEFQHGVLVQQGGTIQGGTIGTLTVEGAGGVTNSFKNFGVFLLGANPSTNSIITSLGANIIVNGYGSGTNVSNENHGVYLSTRGKISAGGNGSVTVQGWGNNINNPGQANAGVYITDKSEITSNNGNISIIGEGGGKTSTQDSRNNFGIIIDGISAVKASGSGSITMSGTGGGTAGDNNVGVIISGRNDIVYVDSTSNSLISTKGGNIQITGQGGGTGISIYNYGIWIVNGPKVIAGGSGTATLNGTGGATTGNENLGVIIAEFAATVTSINGNVSVTGQGGGTGTSANSYGVYLTKAGTISAGGMGTVTVNGTGGNGSGGGNHGIHLGLFGGVIGTGAFVTSGGGNIQMTGTEGGGSASYGFNSVEGNISTAINGGTISLIANKMKWDATTVISTPIANSDFVLLQQRTNSTLINVGSTTDAAANTLELSDAELDRISTKTVKIGDSNSGAILVTGVISPLNYKTLAFGNNSSFTNPGGFLSDIASTTNYEAMAVTGNANLTNASFEISWGSYDPQVGNSFTLLTCSSRTGNFALVTIPPIEGLVYNLVYSTTSVVLQIQATPPLPGVYTTIAANGWNNASSWDGNGVPPNPFPTGKTIIVKHLNNIPNAVEINGLINWNTPNDSISINFQVTGAGAFNFIAKTINIVAPINLTDTGNLTMTASKRIYASTTISVVNGKLTLLANQQTTPTAGTFYGIHLNGGMVKSLGTGIVTVKGKGGNTDGFQHGVYIQQGGTIQGGTIGTVTVEGRGGLSQNIKNWGVYLLGVNPSTVSTITSLGANVVVDGYGSGTNASNENHGVFLTTYSKISAGGTGTVTIQGWGNNTNYPGDSNYGINLSDHSEITSNNGNIFITGEGGGKTGSTTSRGNYGVNIDGISSVKASGSGSITIIGTGGGTGGNINAGVIISGRNDIPIIDSTSNSLISTKGGNIQITGQGGGTGPSVSNYGIWIFTGPKIIAGGNGTVTLNGTGGITSGNSNWGVVISGFTAAVTSINGNVSVTGQGGGSSTSANSYGVYTTQLGTISAGGVGTVTVNGTGGAGSGGGNHGIFMDLFGTGAIVTSGGGNVQMTGTEGGGTTSYGINSLEGTVTTAANGGTITLIANKMNLNSTTIISTKTGSSDFVLLRQRSNTTPISVGSTTDAAANTLELSDAELDRITTKTVKIGDNNSGAISVVAVISPLNYKTLTLNNNATFNNPGGFLTDIASTSDFETMNVSGSVDITNGTLQVSWGSFEPPVGSSFTLLTCTSRTGNFSSYSIPTIDGLTYNLVYSATSVVLQILATPPLPGVYTTIASNGWNTASSWDANGVPPNPFPSGNTIIVKHLNNIPNNLEINGVLNWNTPNNTVSISHQLTGKGKFSFTATTIEINESINLIDTGNLSMTASRNIYVNTGAIVSVINGNLTLLANQQTTPTSGTFFGININGAIVKSLGTGIVTVKGKGGTVGDFQYGVHLQQGGTIQGGTSGTVTVEGRGGLCQNQKNYGVYLLGANPLMVSDPPIVSLITSLGANIIVDGYGGGGILVANENHGVYLSTRSKISAGGNGTVTIQGLCDNSNPLGDSNYGVYVTDKSEITSNNGNISIIGQGGGKISSINSRNNYGVNIDGISAVKASGAGSITIFGTAGGTAGNNNVGIVISGRDDIVVIDSTSNSLISTKGGNINISGQGGGTSTSNSNYGVWVNIGPKIIAGGNGTVTLNGTGGTTSGNDNWGVLVGEFAATVTSFNGNVSVTGQGGGTGTSADNYGVYMRKFGVISAGGIGTVTVSGIGGVGSGGGNHGVFMNIFGTVLGTGATVTSGGGNIQMTGTEGGGAASYGIYTIEGTITTATNGGNITLIANKMNFTTTSVISTKTIGSEFVLLRQRSNATPISVGSTTDIAANTLELSDAELDKITTKTVKIGDANSGAISVTAVISPLNYKTLALGNGSSFTNPGGFLSDIASTSNYETMDVTGNANLTNASLQISWGSFTPVIGNSFTILTCSSRTGKFSSVTIPPVSGLYFNVVYNATSVVIQVQTVVLVSPKVFLEGPHSTVTSGTSIVGLMNDNLRQLSLIPSNEPYTGLTGFAQFGGGGGESFNPSVLTVTGVNAIVDWVFIELRNKNNASTILATRSALLQRDGDIVDVDGTSPVPFPNFSSDSYFITIRHRNHLGVRTLNPISLSGTAITTLDLTPVSAISLVTGVDKMKLITTSVGDRYALWSGDVINSSSINATDRSSTWNDRNTSGYKSSDCNLDGNVNATDRSITWNNRNKSN
jgi:mucin-19